MRGKGALGSAFLASVLVFVRCRKFLAQYRFIISIISLNHMIVNKITPAASNKVTQNVFAARLYGHT